MSGSASSGSLVSGLINIETQLVTELSQLATLGTDITASTWFGPAVEQLALIQGQMTSLLTTVGTADPNFSADVQAEVNNEQVIATLLTEVATSGSSSGSGSTSGSGSSSMSGSTSGSGSSSMSGSTS